MTKKDIAKSVKNSDNPDIVMSDLTDVIITNGICNSSTQLFYKNFIRFQVAAGARVLCRYFGG